MNKELIIYEVYHFNDLREECWSGAIDRLDQAEEIGVEKQVVECINNYFITSGSVTMTELNDYIWFDDGLENDLKTYYNIDLWGEDNEDLED